MIGQSAAMLIAMATMAASLDGDLSSLSHGQLQVGQRFEIATADQVFRGVLVDRTTGECQMTTSTDGTNFSSPRTVYLLGATAGRQGPQMMVLMREVRVGLKMELGVDSLSQDNRLVTSNVRAIRLIK